MIEMADPIDVATKDIADKLAKNKNPFLGALLAAKAVPKKMAGVAVPQGFRPVPAKQGIDAG